MDRIWANRLIAGTKTWNEVPEKRKEAVLAELKARVDSGEITQERLDEIINA
ncbi:MAG: hypothetical protein IJU76_14190 [Desulfovibrionaceae bacterium]|nr:hypothetical protein [Desulfovibrionaceae bacterium]